MYLSLSLEQRIRPRHRFLVALKKAPKGPFPLSSFVPNDECFCQQWAGTSLDKYLAFRQSLLLSQFAKKYKKEQMVSGYSYHYLITVYQWMSRIRVSLVVLLSEGPFFEIVAQQIAEVRQCAPSNENDIPLKLIQRVALAY